MPNDKIFDRVLALVSCAGLSVNTIIAMGVSVETFPVWFTAGIGILGMISLAALILRDIKS